MDDWTVRQKGIVLASLTVFLLAAVGVLLWRLPRPASPLAIETPAPSPAPEIKAYVTGEVLQPGVVSLVPGDRVDAAVRAAGGATERADLDRINLALRVKDQDHIHVPQRPDPQAPASGPPTPTEGGPLDLNTATAAQLDTLPGLGPVTVKRILDHRQQNGPFRTVEELRDLKLVNQSTFDKIKDLLVVR